MKAEFMASETPQLPISANQQQLQLSENAQ